MKIQAAVSRTGSTPPQIEELDLDEPRADEVRVRIVASGICHTDLSCHRGQGVPVPLPIVLGHEGAGVVEGIGAGVRGLQPGDHVVLSGASCGLCPSCRAARPTYCRDAIKLSFGGMRADGSSPLSQGGSRIAGAFFAQSSFATHVNTPQSTAVKVPPDVPLHLLGPLGCGLITGAGAMLEALKVAPGQSVVIFGVGSVGLAAVMAARIAGASSIVAVDVSAERLRLARSLGATEAVPSNDGTAAALREIQPYGFTYSFNTTHVPAIYTLASACLANEGTAGIVTRPQGEWTLNVSQLLAGGRRMQGILGGSANPQLFIPLLIDYWRQGRFAFDRLISEFAFRDLDRAWQAATTGEVIKPVLKM
ncbi:MAG TPA: NAD(P)-dependent alcohol dehydrogenase [Steroidobacteraceae bacterium]|nr:NAD(P)-dependent alcohol dehydrogenase [Steroidobacteraceae bacterium]